MTRALHWSDGLSAALATACEHALRAGGGVSIVRGNHDAPVEVRVDGVRPDSAAEHELVSIADVRAASDGVWIWKAN